MIRSVLVIGASGNIGSAIRDMASLHSNDSFNFFYTYFSKPANCRSSIWLDILDEESTRSLIKSFDIIVNCTGQETTPIENCYLQNSDGLFNLIRAVKDYGKFLFHLSSSAVYGDASYPDENCPLNFKTVYGAAKAFAEKIIENTLDKDSYLILRVPSVFSEKQDKGLFHYLRKQHLGDKSLNFNNDGNSLRTFVHVNDCARSILSLVYNGSTGIFNMYYSDIMTIREIVHMIELNSGKEFNAEYLKSYKLESISGLNTSRIESQIDSFISVSITEFIQKNFC